MVGHPRDPKGENHGYLTTFRGINAPKSGPFKYENNAQTLPKQLQNKGSVQKKKCSYFVSVRQGGGYQTDFCLTEGRKWTHVKKHFCQIKYCSYHANPPFLVDFGLTQNTILVEKYFISRYHTISPLPFLYTVDITLSPPPPWGPLGHLKKGGGTQRDIRTFRKFWLKKGGGT